jgi:hypothetical protein
LEGGEIQDEETVKQTLVLLREERGAKDGFTRRPHDKEPEGDVVCERREGVSPGAHTEVLREVL